MITRIVDCSGSSMCYKKMKYLAVAVAILLGALLISLGKFHSGW